MPCVHSTRPPDARDDASDSSADLPTPGSPRTITTPPRPAAASANKASSRALSEARPQSMPPTLPSGSAPFHTCRQASPQVQRESSARHQGHRDGDREELAPSPQAGAALAVFVLVDLAAGEPLGVQPPRFGCRRSGRVLVLADRPGGCSPPITARIGTSR